MNRKTYVGIVLALVVLVGVAAWASRDNAGPSAESPSATSTPLSPAATSTNTTGLPLTVAPGFSVSVFARRLPDARVMAFDPAGNLWVSQPARGTVSVLEIADDGSVARQDTVFRALQKPHGLAFDPANPYMLYIAEEHQISRVTTYSDDPLQKIADLPASGGHTSRTIGFGPDGRLYVSIGSSCNVCQEADDRRAKILSMMRDGTDIKEYARGLRNAVFFAWNQGTMWATEMGRDRLGDDIPPDELNVIVEGKNYGWPICYGKNIHDTDFDKNTYIRNPCMEPFEMPSTIDIPAHSAPLGLAFVPESWPDEYRDDLIVAYHGSWNRSIPTGYKLVRHKFDGAGRYEGVEDFIAGWHDGKKAQGRPVALLFGRDGMLYVSDDHAGVIYMIRPLAP